MERKACRNGHRACELTITLTIRCSTSTDWSVRTRSARDRMSFHSDGRRASLAGETELDMRAGVAPRRSDARVFGCDVRTVQPLLGANASPTRSRLSMLCSADARTGQHAAFGQSVRTASLGRPMSTLDRHTTQNRLFLPRQRCCMKPRASKVRRTIFCRVRPSCLQRDVSDVRRTGPHALWLHVRLCPLSLRVPPRARRHTTPPGAMPCPMSVILSALLVTSKSRSASSVTNSENRARALCSDSELCRWLCCHSYARRAF